jgi:hypothetical protein
LWRFGFGGEDAAMHALRLLILPAILGPALLSLAGCGSLITEGTSAAAGVAGAGIASGVTHNGTVTAAIGLGVQSLASTGLGYVERTVHRAEQDQIAAAAGTLPVGGVAAWRVSHDIPIEADEHGQVSVSREIGGGELACKEIVFSVDHVHHRQPDPSFYVASICRDGGMWKWASAEPSTTRWGSLQ